MEGQQNIRPGERDNNNPWGGNKRSRVLLMSDLSSPLISPTGSPVPETSAATQSNTTVPNSTSIITTTTNGLSKGAEVGIAIGAAAGFLIIFLAGAWICSKSRRSRVPYHNNDPETPTVPRKTLIKGRFVPTRTTPAAREDNILERVDDIQIRKYMRDLNGLILQHAENHYHGRKFESRPEDLARDLAKCGYDESTNPSAAALSGLLCNPATRTTAIRQLIVSVIIRLTELRCDPETSLLPSDIAQYCQLTFKGKGILDGAFNKSHSVRRALSTPVLSSTETSEYGQSLRPGVTRTLQLLYGVLHHFIIAGAEHQRVHSQNLSEIILEGARFGIYLFAQPSPWAFGWEAAAKASRGLVVFPSISEVIVVGGEDLLRLVVEAVLVEL